MRVLLVEPQPLIATAIQSILLRGRIDTDIMTEEEFQSLAPAGSNEQLNYTAIVLGSVEQDPVNLVRFARDRFEDLPTLALLTRKDPDLSAALLDAGADDVMVKPITDVEAAARIRARARRASGRAQVSEKVGDVTVYFDGSDPEIHGQRLQLSGREHAVFMHLATNKGRIIGKESLYEAVYGLDGERPLGKVIDVYICKLRKKLASATGGQNYIETVFNRGYKFDDPARTVEFRQLPAVEAYAA